MLRYTLAAVGCATLLLSAPAFAVIEDYSYPGTTCRSIPWAIAGSFQYLTSPAGIAFVHDVWENNTVSCPFRATTYSTQTYGIYYVGLYGYHNTHAEPVSCTLTIRQGNGSGILYSESRSSPTTEGLFH
jgi:hypothetical protein